ncbi:hypothetical protein [Aeromonas sp. SG16]|uniref:hypothetical protein n=1 Tax=Aeromonas sp. SG16 TaxID=2950548 RepID=UPI0021091ABB|nr:hypothetical protein [Aeromonas sp. SG16]MCQ4052368.1 hypothetical protein [Aeromonas sp. SG16]
MGVSGLAEGFLAGFNTMDRYQRGQQEQIRQERELGLRDAMVKQNKEDSDRNFSLRKAEFDNMVGQQKTAKEQWGQEFGLRQQEAEGLRAYRNANLGFAQAAESRAKQEHDWQVSERANQKLLEDSLPLIESAFQARLKGDTDPAGYVDLMKNKEFQKGGALYRFNFDRYSDGKHLQAARQIVPQISGLMKDIDSGKVSWGDEDGQRAIVQRVNSPEIISPLNTILEQEVKRGIGEVDAASGKKIADKELTHVIPTEDGRGVMYGLKVTYADGSTADSVVTEGRSTQPGDPVKVSKWGDLIKTVYERSNMYQQLSGAGQNRETLNRVGQSLGLAQPADLKGWQKARSQYANETQRGEAKILASGDTNAKALAAEFVASREKGAREIDRIYNVDGGKKSGTTSAEPDAPPKLPEQVSGWAGNDKRKQSFIDAAVSRGFDFSTYTPEQLDGEYQSIIKKQRQQSAYEAIMGGGKQ